MEVNDWVKIKSGLDVYQTVSAAAASAASAAPTAAKNSRGIGQITQFDGQWIRIKWLKGEYAWWYLNLRDKLKVIQSKNIEVLYGKNNNSNK